MVGPVARWVPSVDMHTLTYLSGKGLVIYGRRKFMSMQYLAVNERELLALFGHKGVEGTKTSMRCLTTWPATAAREGLKSQSKCERQSGAPGGRRKEGCIA